MKKSTKICRNDVWKLLEINRDNLLLTICREQPKLFLDTEHLACKSVPWICLGTFAWQPRLGTCPWKPVPGNLFLDTYPWKPCVVTLLGNLLLGPLHGHFGNLCKPVPGNNLFLGTLLRNLAWEPALWNLASKPVLGNFWEPWEPDPGNLAWEPLPGNLFLRTSDNLAWEPDGNLLLGTLLGNLFLETFENLWESFETCSWEPCFGTSSWGPWEPCLETLLGDLAWEPCLETWLGNLAWKPARGNQPCLGTLS